MTEHLSQQIIEDVVEKRIEGDDLLALDDHLAACPVCADAVAAAAGARDEVRIDVTSPHLTFETLEGHTNGTLGEDDRDIANAHLEGCTACAAELDELRRLRVELESQTPSAPTLKKPWFESIFRPSFLVPAFGALIAVAVGVWWLSVERPTESPQVAAGNVNELPQPETTDPNNPAIENPPPPGNSAEEPPVTVQLRDGNSSIVLYADGRVSGVNGTAFEARVRNALSKNQINIATDARELSGANGVLMGGETSGVPFALSSPIGRVVESSQPTLSWKGLPGAESYRVEIFDENFSSVATSSDIATTTWRPQRPLSRGKIYAWQVTAVKNGVESKSPVRPAPDAKFKVIDAGKLETILSARRTGSSLALGLAYAEAGMLPEAEREFASLAKANPGSEAVAKLLQKVRAAR